MFKVEYQSEIKNLHYLGLVTVSCRIKAVWICSVAGLVHPFIGGWNFQVQQCLLKSNSHGNNLSLNILAQRKWESFQIMLTYGIGSCTYIFKENIIIMTKRM